MTVRLSGYEHSVYSWIARLALGEKHVAFEWLEVNPFDASPPEHFQRLNSFGRVPVLQDGEFVVYETTAITRYVDEQFAGPALQPSAPRARALQNQIISIADSSCYWPMVRQVFSHRIFRPRFGKESEPGAIEQGLAASADALAGLEGIIADEPFLTGASFSLADIHLFPMIAYFAMAPEGEEILHRHDKLAQWRALMSKRAVSVETAPELIALGG